MPVQLAPLEIVHLVGNWWDEINESTQWQDGIFYALCAAYALVSAVALVFFFLYSFIGMGSLDHDLL